MAIPSTNTSLDGIQTEFGGTNPISLSEYYSGGSFVPASAPANLNRFVKVSVTPVT